MEGRVKSTNPGRVITPILLISATRLMLPQDCVTFRRFEAGGIIEAAGNLSGDCVDGVPEDGFCNGLEAGDN